MGAGKTTLAAAWAAARSAGEVAWLAPATTTGAGEALAGTLGQVLSTGAATIVLDGLTDPADLEVVAAARTGGRHLVVLTRRPLVAELARLRLDPGFHQVHDSDLRLDPEELAQLVELHVGSRPAPALAEVLCEAIEGWTAGAVVLAVSWEPGAVVADHQTVLGRGLAAAAALAVSATVDGVDSEVAELLELTSSLRELSPGVCDAVSGRDDSRAALRSLSERGTLLAARTSEPGLVALHPLARAGLTSRSTTSDAARATLLGTAARWFADHQHPLLAIRCYSDLGEWESVGEVAVAHLHHLESQGRVHEMADVVANLPPSLLRQHWKWVVLAVWMRYAQSDPAGAWALLGLCAPGARPDQVIIAEYLRGVGATQLSDPGPALEAVERGLALCDEVGEDATFDDVLVVSTTEHWRVMLRASGMLAGGYLGEWERTTPLLTPIDPSTASAMRPGEIAAARGRRSFHLAARGDLLAAEHEAVTIAATVSPADRHATAESVQSRWAMAEVHRLRGAFDEVPDLLVQAVELGPSNPNLLASVAATRSLLALDLHDPERALRVLAVDRERSDHVPPPTVAGWIAAAEGTALAALGEGDRAREVLLRARRTSAVAAAMVLVALDQNEVAAAQATLDAWPDDVSLRSVVGRSLASAAIQERLGLRREATQHLERALALAAPQGMLQPFLAAGGHVLGPLSQLAQGGPSDAVDLAERAASRLRAIGVGHRRLTARERLVMEQLATGAPLPAIAERLAVSVNTVKTQVRSIYQKLGVGSRDEATDAWRAHQREGST